VLVPLGPGLGTVFLRHFGHISLLARPAAFGESFANVLVPVITFGIAASFLGLLRGRGQLVDSYSQEPLHHVLTIVGPRVECSPILEQLLDVFLGDAVVAMPHQREDVVDGNDRHARRDSKLLIEQRLRLGALLLVLPDGLIGLGEKLRCPIELVDPSRQVFFNLGEPRLELSFGSLWLLPLAVHLAW